MSNDSTRRRFVGLALGGAAGCGLLVASSAGAKPEPKEEEEVAPAEDLMREHGVLKRVLLVYGEAIRRIDARADLPPEPIADAARIITTSSRSTTRSSRRTSSSPASARPTVSSTWSTSWTSSTRRGAR